MSKEPKTRIILTGRPGIGKTTVILKVCQLLIKSDVPVHGFYTTELKKDSVRVGFDICDVNGGSSAMLARISRPLTFTKTLTVGKYNVFINDFNYFQNDMFRKLPQKPVAPVVIIDEIGKMELLSDSFKNNVKEVFDNDYDVIATIPIATNKPIPFVDDIRRDKRNQIILVDATNRDTLPEMIVDLIKKKKVP